jgi:hypothetical protein
MDQVGEPTPPVAVSATVFPVATVAEVGLTASAGTTVTIAEAVLEIESVTTTVSTVPDLVPAAYVQLVFPLQEPRKLAPELFGTMDQFGELDPPMAVNVTVSPVVTVFAVGAMVSAGFTVMWLVAVLFRLSVTVMTSVTPLPVPVTQVQVERPVHDDWKYPPELFCDIQVRAPTPPEAVMVTESCTATVVFTGPTARALFTVTTEEAV